MLADSIAFGRPHDRLHWRPRDGHRRRDDLPRWRVEVCLEIERTVTTPRGWYAAVCPGYKRRAPGVMFGVSGLPRSFTNSSFLLLVPLFVLNPDISPVSSMCHLDEQRGSSVRS